MLLSGTARLVVVSFMSFNLNFLKQVPACIKKKEQTFIKSAPRKRIQGKIIVSLSEGVSGLPLLNQLSQAGYVLVSASQEIKKTREGRPFVVVQFVFAVKDYAQPSENFDRDEALAFLYQLFGRYMWSMTAYNNPLFENGEPVDGQRCLVVNLDKRQPLFDEQDKPMTRWWGEHMVPIEPKFFLAIENDNFCVKR